MLDKNKAKARIPLQGYCVKCAMDACRQKHINALALAHGYFWRLDITPKNGLRRTEFVRTMQEARFVGRGIRRLAKGEVQFYKLLADGSMQRSAW